ncbi:hypothetical protein INT47_010329 [Mucor saturninus]|uniref:Uncharacterized protein n=1 Tax=Mucor saturninus TaxID=64648 RepID=A0A8H7UPC5_9FUNG|nr:hypothetical protein INT47_010329 [Mucor saturninus]
MELSKKMTINYFFRTAAKDWDIVEAIICYDQEESRVETSLYQLLLRIKSDLKAIGKTQTQVELRFLGVGGSGTQGIQNEGFAAINVNNISQNEQVNIDGVNNVTVNIPVTTDVGEGSSMYNTNPPYMPVQRPHKPKLRKVQTEALNQFVYFGTSFSQSNPTFQNLYNQYKNEQKLNHSLTSHGLFNHVVELLDSEVNYDLFLKEVWTFKLDKADDGHKEAFFNIVQYTLTAFHLVYKSPSVNISNHERTHFVENIIPSLLALGKTLDFSASQNLSLPKCLAKKTVIMIFALTMQNSDNGFASYETIRGPRLLELLNPDEVFANIMIEYSYPECTTGALMGLRIFVKIDLEYRRDEIDEACSRCLQTSSTYNNMELIIVEASSGQLKEHITHSIEDTLKILECGISSLRKEAAYYNDAFLSKFMSLEVYRVHVIESQVTLSAISLDDESPWKCIELRSAKLPNCQQVGVIESV